MCKFMQLTLTKVGPNLTSCSLSSLALSLTCSLPSFSSIISSQTILEANVETAAMTWLDMHVYMCVCIEHTYICTCTPTYIIVIAITQRACLNHTHVYDHARNARMHACTHTLAHRNLAAKICITATTWAIFTGHIDKQNLHLHTLMYTHTFSIRVTAMPKKSSREKASYAWVCPSSHDDEAG
jgi:hypothetical protein